MALPLVPLLLSAGVLVGTYALGKRAAPGSAPAPTPQPLPRPMPHPAPAPAPTPDNGGGFLGDIIPPNINQPLTGALPLWGPWIPYGVRYRLPAGRFHRPFYRW